MVSDANRNDCPYHVRLHPDEQCTCPQKLPTHDYISTACHHELHDKCRRSCKFCAAMCGCACGHPVTDDDTPQQTHVLERTSALGELFVGTCTLCGVSGLRATQANEACRNPRRVSAATALLDAVQGPKPGLFTPEYVNDLLIAVERAAHLKAELLRLCGPVCPYDGKRASEHYRGGSDDCMETRYSGSGAPCGFPDEWWIHDLHGPNGEETHVFVPSTHPKWPDGEEWLRSHA